MPNHCTNQLIVSGPAPDVDALVLLMKGEANAFDFNKVIPMPEALKNTAANVGNHSPRQKANLKEHGYTDWYSWAIANWGTKWGAYEVKFDGSVSPLELLAEVGGEKTTKQVGYTFDTAWSPPMPILQALVERFPTCTFAHDCIDEGGGFGAHFVWKNGDFDNPTEDLQADHTEDIHVTQWHEQFRYEPEDDEEDGS